MRNIISNDRPSEEVSVYRGRVTGNSKDKATLCWQYWYVDKCTYGNRCKYAHPPKNMRNSRLMNQNTSRWKTCRYKSLRMSQYGEQWKYLHTEPDNCEERREDLYRKDSVDSIQPVDVDSRSNKRQCTNLMNTFGSVSNYALGQAGSSTSAFVLASESGNAHTAPKTLVKDALPKEVQKPLKGLKPTTSEHKLPPRFSSFERGRPRKMVGIYADWIDD